MVWITGDAARAGVQQRGLDVVPQAVEFDGLAVPWDVTGSTLPCSRSTDASRGSTVSFVLTRRTTWRTAARSHEILASTRASSSVPRTSLQVRVKRLPFCEASSARSTEPLMSIATRAAAGVSVNRRPW